ncbi:MAG: peptide-methionine (S)-S-oxide reductase MsrA [Acidobacteria bacterium]|nr:peptide-methionine (S)-S-oxide reductase MsrA [Acidobacteriota bacterium]
MHPQRWLLIAALVLGGGYFWLSGGLVGITDMQAQQGSAAPAAEPQGSGMAAAIFAAGCFWCTEADFDKVPGVVSTTSGYTGGRVVDPTYRQVSSGGTGHTEAVRVVFDPSVVSYEALLEHYWKNVDPFVANRQFCDSGTQYRPEIFYDNEAQKSAAEASKAEEQKKFQQQIVVAITPAGPFYGAEDYHQDYYKKNSAQYRFYRFGCGRDRRLEQIADLAG